jgi:hypothetical protein
VATERDRTDLTRDSGAPTGESNLPTRLGNRVGCSDGRRLKARTVVASATTRKGSHHDERGTPKHHDSRQRGSAACLRAAVRIGFPDRRDVAEAVRRDGLPARGTGLSVGLSRRVVRVHPAHTQAGFGHRLQRHGHCRQLRRPRVGMAHGQRHDDLRRHQHRRRPGSGRDRHPARRHCRPIGRLLAAFAGRRRPARARRGQRRQVPPAATGLRRQRSVRLLRSPGNNAQPQPLGARHRRRQRRARRRSAHPERQGLLVERARRSQAEQVRLDLGQADRHDAPRAGWSTGRD